MTSEFLALIITLLEEDFAVPLLQGRQRRRGAAFVRLSEDLALFMTLIFGNSPGSVCSHDVLHKSTTHQCCWALNPMAACETPFPDLQMNVASSDSHR